MKIGLIDVDGHNFPNLALMRISAYHKARGDDVEWWLTDFYHYDIVYMSKIFSSDYTPDMPEPMNADKVIKGGTGYCILLVDGKEVFDQSKNVSLPPDVEKCFPDYSIYPQFDFAVAMTSRGCPRGCAFCHVAAKEGRCAVKVADVKDFWNGQKRIEVLDPNITACREKRDLLRQYRETGAWINFNQGIDIRLVNDADIDDLNGMKIKRLHFAWDNPEDDLEDVFRRFSERWRIKDPARKIVYVLTNFGSTMEQNLHRIYTLRDLGYDPDVRIYDKPHAPKEVKDLQRWCNNRIIFKSCPRFEDYDPKKGQKGGRAVNDDEEQLALFEGAEQKPQIPDAQREKRRWENRFQEWSNEQALSGLTHYGACGYGAICNYCDGDPEGRACVRALNEMLRTKRLSIDYKATTYEQAFDGEIGKEATE